MPRCCRPLSCVSNFQYTNGLSKIAYLLRRVVFNLCMSVYTINQTRTACATDLSLFTRPTRTTQTDTKENRFSFQFLFFSSGSKITRYINIVLYALIVTQNCIHSFVARATFNLVRIIDNGLQ